MDKEIERIDILERTAQILIDDGMHAEILQEYSGRGMWGARIEALVTNAPPIKVGLYLGIAIHQLSFEAQEEPVDVGEAIQTHECKLPTRRDSMGADDSVYY